MEKKGVSKRLYSDGFNLQGFTLYIVVRCCYSRELLNQVYYGKEAITIERAGKAMAIIIPLEEYNKWQEKEKKIKETLVNLQEHLKEL